MHPSVNLEQEDNTITVKPATDSDMPMAGTIRSLVNNMVVGVSDGFEKKLTLVGVGYRAQVQGTKLVLALGYSHPIEYTAPQGVTIEAPSQTEIVVKGCDKQKVIGGWPNYSARSDAATRSNRAYPCAASPCTVFFPGSQCTTSTAIQ